ncbi:tomoregulin-1 isoform X1 [Sinocyclocheilus grahami]|uniref:tomoregulin-1 isoform X1 n=1 Tax=Sinocyclocheilus grahami TaxID=75366 RepID=UPI0007AD516E|nr:PREDICTED: tomoregulin-1-like isoform X1 [Sinocyclocheilus grahami]
MSRIMPGGSCAAGAGCCLAMFGLLVLAQMPGALTSDTDSDCLSEDDKGCEGLSEKKSDLHVCDEYNCSFGGICRYNGSHLECLCLYQCPQSFAPVCASDGNTYHSECFLRQTACEQQTAITVITEGHCHADAESASGDTDLESSGLEPSRFSKCSSCKFGAECDEDSEGIWCVCNIDCSGYNMNPVCGSDGQSYSNPCQIREASCLKQSQIDVKYLGQCPDSVDLVGGVSVGGTMPCAEINSSFCLHGTCEMKNSLATCKCDLGFSGVQCERRDFSELYVVPNGQKLQYILIAVIIAAVQISIIITIIICITRIHPKKPRGRLQKQTLGHFPKDGGRMIE